MQQTGGGLRHGGRGVAKDTFADTYAGQRQPKYVARYFNMTQKSRGQGAWLDGEQAKERERARECGRVGRGKSKP